MSDATWMVLTKARSGTVSLIRDLTEDAARTVAKNLQIYIGPQGRFCADSDPETITLINTAVKGHEERCNTWSD